MGCTGCSVTGELGVLSRRKRSVVADRKTDWYYVKFYQWDSSGGGKDHPTWGGWFLASSVREIQENLEDYLPWGVWNEDCYHRSEVSKLRTQPNSARVGVRKDGDQWKATASCEGYSYVFSHTKPYVAVSLAVNALNRNVPYSVGTLPGWPP